MNCPMCGEPWNRLVCGSCFWMESTHIRPPNWWKQCVANEHDTSVEERHDGRFEFWCSDCRHGAGKSEVRGEAKA